MEGNAAIHYSTTEADCDWGMYDLNLIWELHRVQGRTVIGYLGHLAPPPPSPTQP